MELVHLYSCSLQAFTYDLQISELPHRMIAQQPSKSNSFDLNPLSPNTSEMNQILFHFFQISQLPCIRLLVLVVVLDKIQFEEFPNRQSHTSTSLISNRFPIF